MRRTADRWWSFARFVGGAIALAAGLWTADIARGSVLVVLDDGRRIRAEAVDPATSEHDLVLRSSAEGIVITRRVAWSRVASVDDGGADGRRATGAMDATVRPASWPAMPQHGPHRPRHACVPMQSCVSCVATGGYGRVLGVRDDPMQAYAPLLPAVYPAGVPLNEVPYALGLLRELRAQQVLPVFAPPVLIPPLPIEPPPPAGE